MPRQEINDDKCSAKSPPHAESSSIQVAA